MAEAFQQWFGRNREPLGIIFASLAFTAVVFFTPPSVCKAIDFVLFYEPNFDFLLDSLRAHRLPLWNPYVSLGRPYLADIQNPVFYPPIYLILFGKQVGVFLLLSLHVALAGFGMSLLGRVLRLSKPVTSLLATTFVASVPLSGRLFAGQISYSCAMTYIPLLFYLAIACHEATTLRKVSALSLALGLQMLCGHPQMFWMTSIGLFAFIIGRSISANFTSSLHSAAKGACLLSLSVICSFGLAAVALLPCLELLQQGNRPELSVDLASFVKLRLVHFLTLGRLFPYGFVDWERNMFLGFPLLIAGICGLSRMHDRNVRGMLLAALVAIVIGFANATPAFDFLLKFLPGFARFRIHARMGFLVVFALILLAGIWIERPHPWLGAFVRSNVQLSRSEVLGVFIALQLLHLAYGIWNVKHAYTFETIFRRPPEYPFVQDLVSRLKANKLLTPEQPPPRVCVPLELVPANFAITYHYSTFDAYTALILNRPWQYLHHVFEIQPPHGQNTSIAEAVYEHAPFMRKELCIAEGVDPRNGSLVVNSNLAPRAFLVYETKRVADMNEAIRVLRSGEDIYKRALVEPPLISLSPNENPSPSASAVAIERFSPNLITCKVHAERDALLVLSEAWYPGWNALIQNRPIQAIPVNGWMRAFPVARGDYTVKIFFRQNRLVPGATISLLALAACILGCTRRSQNNKPFFSR